MAGTTRYSEKLIWWGLGILVSMVPVVQQGLSHHDDGGWKNATAHGELLIVAVVIAAAALSTTAQLSRRRGAWRAVSFGASLLVALIGVGMYADVHIDWSDLAPGDVTSIRNASYKLLIGAVILSVNALSLEHLDG